MADIENTSAEAAFAANLRNARVARGLTQAQVAEGMARAGFKWHPPTVYKVENGERQIQLGEALELARILELNLTDMATHQAATRDRLDIERATKSLVDATSKVILEILKYRAGCLDLQEVLRRPGIEHAIPAEELAQAKGIDEHYARIRAESDQLFSELTTFWGFPPEWIEKYRATFEFKSHRRSGADQPHHTDN